VAELKIRVSADTTQAVRSFGDLMNRMTKMDDITKEIARNSAVSEGGKAIRSAVDGIVAYAKNLSDMRGKMTTEFRLTGKEAGKALQTELENRIKKTTDQMVKLLGEPARRGVQKALLWRTKTFGESLGLSSPEQDFFANATKGLEKSIRTEQIEAALSKVGKAGKALGNVFDPVFAKIRKGALAAAAGISAMGGASFIASKSIEEAEAGIARSTGATGERLAALKGVFREVASSADDGYGIVADVVSDLNVRLNLSGESLKKSAANTLDTAQLTKEGAVAIATAATKAMNAWGLQAETYPDVLDKFYAASQKTGASVTGLSEKMAQSAPILKDLGFGFEGSIALLAEFERNGVEADQMLAGMKHSLATFAKDGVRDASSSFSALVGAIRSAQSSGGAAAIAIDAFGSKAGPVLASAIRQGRFSVDELAAALSKSAGLVQKTADETETFGESWKKSMNALGLAFDPVGKKFSDFGKWMLDGITAFKEWAEKTGIVKKSVDAFTSGLGLTLSSVKNIQKALEDFDVEKFVKKCGDAGKAVGGFIDSLGKIADSAPAKWVGDNLGTLATVIVGGWAGGKILTAAGNMKNLALRLWDLKDGLWALSKAHPGIAVALTAIGLAIAAGIKLKSVSDDALKAQDEALKGTLDAQDIERTAELYGKALDGDARSLSLLSDKYREMAEASLKAKKAEELFADGLGEKTKSVLDSALSAMKEQKLSKEDAVSKILGSSYREDLFGFVTAAKAAGLDAKEALLGNFSGASQEAKEILGTLVDRIEGNWWIPKEQITQVRDLGSEFGRLAQYIPLLFKGTKDDTERIIGLLKTNPAAGLKEFADKANAEIQRIRGNVEPIAKLLTSSGLSGDAVKRGGAYVQEQLAKLRTFYEALSLSTEGLKDQPEEIRRAWVDANVKGEIDKIGMAAKDALAQSKSDVSAVMEAMKSGAMTRGEMAAGWEFVKGKVRDVAGLIRKDISERMTGIPAALHDAIARSDLKKYLDLIGGQWLPSFVKKLQDEAQRVMGKSVDIGKMLGVPSQLSEVMKQLAQTSKPGGPAGAAGSPVASVDRTDAMPGRASIGPAGAFASAFDSAVSSLSSALERNAATVERNTTALRDLAAQIKSGARAVNVTMGSVTVKDADEGKTLGKQLGQGILSPSF
jgi:TP901 family phage tail tape measure protein